MEPSSVIFCQGDSQFFFLGGGGANRPPGSPGKSQGKIMNDEIFRTTYN